MNPVAHKITNAFTFWPYHVGMSAGAVGSNWAALTEDRPSPTAESFARETSSGPLENVANWDDQAVTAGMKAECGDIRALDANYPGKYHRLGTFILESTKRFGGDAVRQVLRAEGISRATSLLGRARPVPRPLWSWRFRLPGQEIHC